MSHRLHALVASGALLLALLVVADPAAARCPPEDFPTYYKYSSVTTIWLPTNLTSSWLVGPGTITYSETTTSEVNGSVTGTISAEAGIVFAKASASIGVTVGGSYAKSGTWTYSASVAAGKTARLQQYRESRQSTVSKMVYDGYCNYKVALTGTMKAPRTASNNALFLWKLVYR
jgi:hypothetical protein